MSTTVRVWSPLEVTITLAGVLIEGGWGDNDFIKIEQSDNDWNEKVGVDGDITIVKTNSTLTKVTISLMQTSPNNDKLTAIRQICLAQNAPGSPLLINDRNGTSKYAAPFFWIQKPPDAPMGKDINNREWVVMCNMDDRFDGSN